MGRDRIGKVVSERERCLIIGEFAFMFPLVSCCILGVI